MDEKFLELLADYAARQVAEKQANRIAKIKSEDAEKAKTSRRIGEIGRSVRRSEAVHDAYRHALLLALGGRSESAFSRDDEN